MQDNKIVIWNNKIVSAGDVHIEYTNRAFRYGDGIFESIRMANGKPLFIEKHFERLQKGMNFFKMEMPELFSPSYFKEQILKLKSLHTGLHNARVRIIVYRNGEGVYAPNGNTTSFIIDASPAEQVGFELNTKGLKIEIFKEILKPIHPLFSFKSANSGIYVLAGIFKNSCDVDDVIILNENKHLCETTGCNLFLADSNDVVYTPPLSDGPLEGVMRNLIIEILKQNQISVIEKSLTEDDLLNAQEAFATNAVKGVQYIMGFKEKRFYNNMSKMLVSKLNELIEL